MTSLNYMNESSTRGVFLSITLLFSIILITIPSIAYAEEINVKSFAFEETTIIEVTNDSNEEVNTFRIWLGSDFSFKSFKTEEGWVGEKTPQGVVIFTSSETIKPGESVKFGVKTDKAKPGINWKALDKVDEQMDTGKVLPEELPRIIQNTEPKQDQSLENTGTSMSTESTFRIIPEKPNIGSSIRVTGDQFEASQKFDFYIDSKKIGNLLTNEDIKKILETVKKIVLDIVSGNHEAVIVKNEKTEVLPVKLGKLHGKITPVNSFIEGLDTVFTENIIEKGKSIQSSGSDKKIKALETQISEQTKAIEIVKEKSKNITSVANSLFEMVSMGIISIEDNSTQEILASHNAKLVSEKGISLIIVQDEKIKINTKSPLQSIASVLFNEAKKQSGAISSIQAIREKTEKKLEKFRSKTEVEKDLIVVSEIRKKSWYERYRWFFTSDGFLVIGGRDTASNSAVVRKHLEKNDKIFHGDIFGSPFFILKNADNAPTVSMNEVAHATVCFSRAWREGMYGVNAYWVHPEQVKKFAPSGEFLPKGSFTIEGPRNFIKAQTLRLAVGIIPQDDNYVLTCGPTEPIKKNSICYAIIEPHGSEMADIAKKIRIEFSKLEDKITKNISIDDFVRVLPAGKSQIKEVNYGNSHTNSL